MSNQMPLPPHEFERGSTHPECCERCGDPMDVHPHKFVGCSLSPDYGVCRVCGNMASDQLHGKPDSGFDIPDDDNL